MNDAQSPASGQIGRRRLAAGIAALAVLLPGLAQAADETGLVDFRLPPQLSLQLSEQWNARLDGERSFEPLSFFGDDLLTGPARPAAAFLDWRPVGGGFRISGGYFAGLGNTDPALAGAGGYEFKRLNSYGSPLSLAGTGSGSASYLGIGWDGNADPAGGWGFKLDLGLMFTGVDGAQGTAGAGAADAIEPRFRSTRDLGSYSGVDGDDQYPVLSIGGRYRW
jgi:hypothetical protein